MFSRSPRALSGVFDSSCRKPRKLSFRLCDTLAVVDQFPPAAGRSKPVIRVPRWSLRNAPAGLLFASTGTLGESVGPSRGRGLAGSWSSQFISALNQKRLDSVPFLSTRHKPCPRRKEVRSSLKPSRSPSTVRRDTHLPLSGTGIDSDAPPLPKAPPRKVRVRSVALAS